MKQSILITGCSSGIGLCAALMLQQQGYQVIASARKPDDVRKLKTLGLQAVQLDVDDDASIAAGLQQTLQLTGGTLYALFNNAGYGQPGAIEDIRREHMRQQFETNVFGPFELTRLVLQQMRQQGYGRIIFNSSVLGFAAMKYRGAYNGSKFAMEGLCDTLRQELYGSDIHVSLIEPGPITSRFRANAVAQFKQNIDIDHSVHSEIYHGVLSRLNKKGPAAPFTLPPEAVVKRVQHALQAKRPKPRYYVTFPTYLFGYLKRFLSTRALDRILLKVSSDENK